MKGGTVTAELNVLDVQMIDPHMQYEQNLQQPKRSMTSYLK